jgi:hypothetical protein
MESQQGYFERTMHLIFTGEVESLQAGELAERALAAYLRLARTISLIIWPPVERPSALYHPGYPLVVFIPMATEALQNLTTRV